jgi:hypothetical protein
VPSGTTAEDPCTAAAGQENYIAEPRRFSNESKDRTLTYQRGLWDSIRIRGELDSVNGRSDMFSHCAKEARITGDDTLLLTWRLLYTLGNEAPRPS